MNNPSTKLVAVFGATGHTGQFIVAELLRRGITPIICGRNPEKLQTVSQAHTKLEIRVASVNDSASLDRAFAGVAIVINCAGPFLDTATPIIAAALRAGSHYLDVTAEQAAARAAFEQFSDVARAASITIIPALAFYGGLADLLATVAMGEWTEADEICVAIALDSWQPTLGTRLTGQRNTHPRVIVGNHRFETLPDPQPTIHWDFPAPFGLQEVVALPFAEIITIASHLRAAKIHSYLNLAPLQDLRNPNTPAPVAADESGRSAQIFCMEVIAKRGQETRQVTVQGRDIYAITAPLITEAVARILDGRCHTTGVAAAGEAFDALDFLSTLPEVKFQQKA